MTVLFCFFARTRGKPAEAPEPLGRTFEVVADLDLEGGACLSFFGGADNSSMISIEESAGSWSWSESNGLSFKSGLGRSPTSPLNEARRRDTLESGDWTTKPGLGADGLLGRRVRPEPVGGGTRVELVTGDNMISELDGCSKSWNWNGSLVKVKCKELLFERKK